MIYEGEFNLIRLAPNQTVQPQQQAACGVQNIIDVDMELVSIG